MKDMISDTNTAYQIPLSPKNSGSINTAPIWKTSVLAIEIIADIIPLFKAVKKLDVKILHPVSRNEKA